jgi:multidrug efflux pump subunit AcrA (membrane-fusion protein)
LKKRSTYFIAGGLLLAIFLIWFIAGRGSHVASQSIKVPVKKGPLVINVITTGELQALNSEDIKGPFGMQQAGIYNVKISDLIPEGTVVKQGDLIATLDKSDIMAKLKDASADMSKIESQYLQTRLDTALDMRKLRDDLLNLKYDMEEKKLVMEQSKYEPPAIIRQAELDMEKTKRSYSQALKNYNLKLQQSRAKMQEVEATLGKQQSKLQQMETIMGQFTVNAPKGGMLIYKKDWSGKKIKVGSTVNAWDPTVATLPDLSVMVSQTYVNEIDISKLKVNQPVEVSVDAFPGRKYKGHITSMANIGEQLPNNQTKVFEVIISLDSKDALLRPAMTTSNIILTQSLPATTLYLPLDCIQGSDNLNFVYKDQAGKLVRQEVIKGPANAESVEIKAGLQENEMVYLSLPADTAKVPLIPIPIDVKEKFRKKQLEISTKERNTPAPVSTGGDLSGSSDGDVVIIDGE